MISSERRRSMDPLAEIRDSVGFPADFPDFSLLDLRMLEIFSGTCSGLVESAAVVAGSGAGVIFRWMWKFRFVRRYLAWIGRFVSQNHPFANVAAAMAENPERREKHA